VRVVDCQSHLHNRTYFEAHVGRHAPPYAERTRDGYVFHTSSGSATPIPSYYFDLDEQMERFDADGIDVTVSSMGAFNVDHLPVEQARDLAMQLNEERAEAERRYPGRFYGLALLPMQDAPAAIETLDSAVRNLGLRGVCIGSNVRGESIATAERLPIYRRIEELGVPLFLHPTSSVMEERVRRYGHEYTVGFMVDSSFAALDLIFSGVLDRHPTLRVVHPHLGGVLPYLAARIDHEYRQPWAGTEPLPQPPSEYLLRFYTDTVSLSPLALELAERVYGADHLLYASDYPYWPPGDGLELVKSHFDRDAREAVLAENAGLLLGLDRRPAPARA
jgi:aminocarboxymuconate-semialdehyde decarboxylase